LTSIVLLAVSLGAFAAAVTDDAHALQGTWTPTKAELAGTPMSDDVPKTITLKLDDGKYEVLVGDCRTRGLIRSTLRANLRPAG
jgi:hypothetical protein